MRSQPVETQTSRCGQALWAAGRLSLLREINLEQSRSQQRRYEPCRARAPPDHCRSPPACPATGPTLAGESEGTPSPPGMNDLSRRTSSVLVAAAIGLGLAVVQRKLAGRQRRSGGTAPGAGGATAALPAALNEGTGGGPKGEIVSMGPVVGGFKVSLGCTAGDLHLNQSPR